MLWIKEVQMVDSVDEVKIFAGKKFPNFEMLDAKIASVFNKIIQNSHFKKKVSLEEQKAQKEDRFLRGRQIAFMIHDYSRVTGARDTVLDYADSFSITLRDDNVQESDTRWDENFWSITNFHRMTFWKVCTFWEYVSLINSKTYWNCTTWNSSTDFDAQLSKVENNGEKKYRSETSIAIFWRWTREFQTGAVVKSRKGLSGVEGGKGICYQWKEKGQCSKGDQRSFRHVSNGCVKPTPKAEPPSGPQSLKTTCGSVSRKRNARGRRSES